MNENDKTTNLKRRGFLVTAGLGSAGAAAGLLVGGKAMTDEAGAAGSKQAAGKGYQLSEHVQNYYRTTRA